MTAEEKEEYYQKLADELLNDNEDLEVESGNNEFVEDASDIESEIEVEPNIEEEDDDENEEQPNSVPFAGFLVGKDGTNWAKCPPQSRIQTHNILRTVGGNVKRGLSNVPNEIFKELITTDIVTIIARHTNKKARDFFEKYNAEHPETPKIWKDVDLNELYAYFGLLLAAGVNHSNKQILDELWQTNALPIYRATMSLHRFNFISRFIRFDDQRTRSERQKTDKAAPISDIWIMFNDRLKHLYTPRSTITVDEQLFPYRGNTRFTQYIPSKPAKYGLKVWWACDASNSYPLKGILYTGREQNMPRDSNQGERILRELTYTFASSGRTIIADNFFTTLEGVRNLKHSGLAYVGTLRKNKRCVPTEMLPNRNRDINSSLFGFHDGISLISYVPKRNKSVLLLSSVHYDDETSGPANKPQAILFYNKNKCGVDVMDQMLGTYSCKRRTRRWPLAFFYNILDIAALAAYILHYEMNGKSKANGRRLFIHSVANELVGPQIMDRMQNPNVIKHFSPRSGIESFLGYAVFFKSSSTEAIPSTSDKKRSCKMCWENDKLQRKTRFLCKECQNSVCLQHSKQYQKCFQCLNVANDMQ